MGLSQSSLRAALATSTLNASRQQAIYPLLVKQPQQPFPNYSRGYHYESANHSVYVQMPDGSSPGQVVLPLHPSPFSSNTGGQSTDPKVAFDEMLREQLGEVFDPRLAGLCVSLMKDPDIIDSVLKNPAFQDLVDDLALEVASSNEEVLHLPKLETSLTPGPKGEQSRLGNAELIPPPVVDTREEKEEREDKQTPPLPPLEIGKEKGPNQGQESNRTGEEKEDVNKIAEGVVGVVCGNCHQPLPRLDLSQESVLADDFVGDIVAAPPPSQNMDRVWRSIQSQSDLLSLIIPIMIVVLMVGLMCIRPSVRERVGAILKSSFSKLRGALFSFGPWRRALRR